MADPGHAEVVQGDMRTLLPLWATDGMQFDAIISDPPYHLASIAKRFGKPGSAPAQQGKDGAAARLSRGFMGWHGDSGDVAFDPETWRLCFDVLKPGHRLAVFGGTRTFWRMAAAIDAAGFEYEDTIAWCYGQGLVLRRSRMKPAWEPILVFRKPGRVQDLGIDECRTVKSDLCGGIPDGRWPANFVHDNSLDVLDEFPDAPGQLARSSVAGRLKTNHVYGKLHHSQESTKPRTDTGSAARFFNQCEFSDLERRLFYVPKAPSSERIYHCTVCSVDINTVERAAHQHGCGSEAHLESHPTLKPLTLMQHLAKLLCPADGLILDPFAGTSTTGVAAATTSRNAVCIEQNVRYAEQGRKRIIEAVASLR